MCTIICCSLMLFASIYHKYDNRKSADPQNGLNLIFNLIVPQLWSTIYLGNLNDETDGRYKRVKRNKLKDILKYSKVCATKKCRQFGNQFKRIINKSVDRCDDFFEFVCNKFQTNDKTTADLTTLETADQEVQQILREDLSEAINNSDPKSVTFAVNMFQGCIDSSKKFFKWKSNYSLNLLSKKHLSRVESNHWSEHWIQSVVGL